MSPLCRFSALRDRAREVDGGGAGEVSTSAREPTQPLPRSWESIRFRVGAFLQTPVTLAVALPTLAGVRICAKTELGFSFPFSVAQMAITNDFSCFLSVFGKSEHRRGVLPPPVEKPWKSTKIPFGTLHKGIEKRRKREENGAFER